MTAHWKITVGSVNVRYPSKARRERSQTIVLSNVDPGYHADYSAEWIEYRFPHGHNILRQNTLYFIFLFKIGAYSIKYNGSF